MESKHLRDIKSRESNCEMVLKEMHFFRSELANSYDDINECSVSVTTGNN
jgi:hypothetical protein